MTKRRTKPHAPLRTLPATAIALLRDHAACKTGSVEIRGAEVLANGKVRSYHHRTITSDEAESIADLIERLNK